MPAKCVQEFCLKNVLFKHYQSAAEGMKRNHFFQKQHSAKQAWVSLEILITLKKIFSKALVNNVLFLI